MISALLLLLIVPGAINEFLTGATPLAAIISNPLVIPFVIGFYGCGVLAIRELVVRWHKGWASVFLLGAAFALVLEGFVTQTFFSAKVIQTGALATYGMWHGVNVVWAVMVLLGNMLMTVAIPILFVRLLYPESKDKTILSNVQLLGVLLVFFSFPILSIVSNLTSQPGVVFETLLAIALLVLLAYVAPSDFLTPSREMARGKSWHFFIVGLLLNTIVFAVVSFGMASAVNPWLTLLLIVLSYMAGFDLLFHLLGRHGNGRRLLALANGLLMFFFFIDGVRAVSGQFSILFVALAFILLLWWVHRTTKKASVFSSSPATPPQSPLSPPQTPLQNVGPVV